MATVTFLTGFKPFRKHFSQEKTTSYPLIKTVSSKTYEYEINKDGLRRKYELMCQAAEIGACLLKGPLTQELEQESRAGKSDKNAATQSLILDFDGIRIPELVIPAVLRQKDIVTIAERVIEELPYPFSKVSYIIHASASMGVKKDQIRLHLDFALDGPTNPKQLKDYLAHLNMEIPWLYKNTILSGTSKSLLYPLDRCLADNSRLIFIGHPSFDGISDPIPNRKDRIILVEKEQVSLDLYPLLEKIDPVKTDKDIKRRIYDLRAAAGLPKGQERTQQIKINGEHFSVTTNPDQIEMSFFQDHGNYVTYNINGGDSHGYYVKKNNPNIVWNFKGETPFLFSQADNETYQWHLQQWPQDKDSVPPEAFVFRDMETNTYWNGLWSPINKTIEFLKQSEKGAFSDFMLEHGGFAPDNVPQWRMIFDPNNPVELDKSKGIVNQWQEPPLLASVAKLEETVTYGITDGYISKHCPLIHLVLCSISGDDKECYEHFINWLAFIFQTRQKAETAWLFHGVEGTGKGILASRIIKPLLENEQKTRSYFHAMKMENLEEQFNSWFETTLIAFVDEFRNPTNTSGENLYRKIKNYITESYSPIRKMRANQELAKNRCNFIFTSNDRDALRPGESDRRWNICPRQEMPIHMRHPGFKQAIMGNTIERELPDFAALLMGMDFDQEKAMSALDNDAKRYLRDAASDTIDEFIGALVEGNLEYFCEVFGVHVNGLADSYKLVAMNYTRKWIREAKQNRECIIFSRELKPIYNVLVGAQENDSKFSKLLAKRGLKTATQRRSDERAKGFRVLWQITDDELEELSKQHLLTEVKM